MIKTLINNPDTQQFGLQLWQHILTTKVSPTIAHEGDVVLDGRTGQAILTIPKAAQPVVVNKKLVDPRTGRVVYDGTDADDARPLTAEEKASYNLPADGSFEMQGNKVFAVPGTYNSRTGSRNHVVGDALVDDSGKVLYSKPGLTAGSDPDLVESLARRVYSGDTTALTGLGRGASGAGLIGAVQKRAGELAQQYKGQPLPDFAEGDILRNRADVLGDQAGARAGGTLNARLDIYAKEAGCAMQQAVEASRNVPRGNWTPVNKAMQMIQAGSSDPNLAQFTASVNTLVNTYAKAINPTGVPTVDDKRHAYEMLSTAQGPEAFEATVQQLQREINGAHKAARGFRASERDGTAAAPIADPTQRTSLPPKASLQDGQTYQTPRGPARWNAQSQTFTTVAP